MLTTVATLLERMNAAGVEYCHWKSNWAHDETLDGETDIDILVRRSQAPAFRAVLAALGFRPAVDPGVMPFPSVEHYHALDPETMAIVHVHAYYRIVTGGSLAKNYRLPIEQMLLENTRRLGALTVPTAGAEVVVFVLRLFLKHTSLIELLLLRRYWDDVEAESRWLVSDEAVEEAKRLAGTFLPVLDRRLMDDAISAVVERSSLLRRAAIGWRIRRRLRPYARHRPIAVWRTNIGTFGKLVASRLRGVRKGLSPATGGAVIAFVGSEATGKSTTIEEVSAWLGKRFTVERVHVGKPPSTAITVVPNLLLPAVRRLLPGQRSTRVSLERAVTPGSASGPPLLFSVRALLLAIDRSVLLARVFRRSANGTIVLCDRYPSATIGALDGAQLDPALSGPGPLRRWIARREAARYAAISPPDVVIYLVAPLDVTLERNSSRSKREDEAYVRARYGLSSSLEFERTTVHRIDTDRSARDVLEDVKNRVWEAL